MPIIKNEISKEMIAKAMQCKDATELIALAKTGGYELTKEEAEAYMVELEDHELDEENIKKIAGGKKPGACCGTLIHGKPQFIAVNYSTAVDFSAAVLL